MGSDYLYIDDDAESATRPQAKAVADSSGGRLTIRVSQPLSFADQIVQLKTEPPEGLVLDLRLDEQAVSADSGEPILVGYRAPALAQELRSLAAEGLLASFPIALWSTDSKFRKSFNGDDTSQDLFDLTVDKDDIIEPKTCEKIALQLDALVRGYHKISALADDQKDAQVLTLALGWSEQPDFLDQRLMHRFSSRERAVSVHEYARFILRELIDQPGPLIDRPTLLARLGCGRDSVGVDSLVDRLFPTARYQGVFGDGWPRWWSTVVEASWRTVFPGSGPLRRLKAEQRVEWLGTRLTSDERIEVASPLHKNYSSRFWSLCQVTREPLAPEDGVLLAAPMQSVWADRLRVSVHNAGPAKLRRHELQLDPLEHSRYESLCKRLC